MESEENYKAAGRFKVSVAPAVQEQSSTVVGRFRLNPGGSPFLQNRGRFSVIPEEESPSLHTKLSGPKIVVDPSPEWDFLVSLNVKRLRYDKLQGLLLKT
jgi:hypothetical protein